MADADTSRRTALAFGLAVLSFVLLGAGLAAGSEGWSPAEAWRLATSPDGPLLIGQIRAPRTLGAWFVGALFGLAGAIAQGLFRNPLADPYLLGSASGASLGVVLVLGGSALTGHAIGLATADAVSRLGLIGAAFLGALGGVSLTLALARGTAHTVRLLLAGVIVGVVLGAASSKRTVCAVPRASVSVSDTPPSAPRKAAPIRPRRDTASAVARPMACPVSAQPPSTSTTPSDAPEAEPSRYGSASGLRNSPCAMAPASPNSAPTSHAPRVRGARTVSYTHLTLPTICSV